MRMGAGNPTCFDRVLIVIIRITTGVIACFTNLVSLQLVELSVCQLIILTIQPQIIVILGIQHCIFIVIVEIAIFQAKLFKVCLWLAVTPQRSLIVG